MYAYNHSCKIVLVGECFVGKTALTQRLAHDLYNEKSNPTIGVDYTTKTFKMNDSNMVKLQIWDTAGQENFLSLIRTYYKDVGGAIIMYDVTKRSTFDKVEFWYNELKNNSGDNYPILLLANKIDKVRVVNSFDGQELAKRLNCLYSETSIKTSQNTFSSIEKFTAHLYNKKEDINAFRKNPLDELHLKLLNSEPKPREQLYDCCIVS